MMLEGVALFALIMVIAHQLVAFPQVKKLRRQLSDIKKLGEATSTGMYKSWRGIRYYALVSDLDGTVRAGFATSGSSVFSGFVEDAALERVHCSELVERLEAIEKPSMVEKAKLAAAVQLRDGLERSVVRS